MPKHTLVFLVSIAAAHRLSEVLYSPDGIRSRACSSLPCRMMSIVHDLNDGHTCCGSSYRLHGSHPAYRPTVYHIYKARNIYIYVCICDLKYEYHGVGIDYFVRGLTNFLCDFICFFRLTRGLRGLLRASSDPLSRPSSAGDPTPIN